MFKKTGMARRFGNTRMVWKSAGDSLTEIFFSMGGVMNAGRYYEARKLFLCCAVSFLRGLALGLWFGIGVGADVPDNGGRIDALGGELERVLDRERRAAGAAVELAGAADSLGDEIGSVQEDIEDARREAGLALEGTDRASELLKETLKKSADVVK